METNLDRLQFLSHLAIRPVPEPLESFGSYLIRTAQLNGVESLRRWYTLLKLHSLKRVLRDNPPLDFGAMPCLLNITQDQLLATTFHYVREKFLCDRKQLFTMLSNALASNFRYCPLCVAEKGYYQLVWRLRIIPGCVQHRCQLRELCPHCGQRLPLSTSLLKIGICTYCWANLADTPAQALTDDEWGTTQVRTADWIYLLQPQSFVYQYPVEEKLTQLRQSLGISFEEVARYLRLQRSVLLLFERHTTSSIMQRYIDYADYLGVSLREVLAYHEHSLDLPEAEIRRIRTVCQTRQQVFIAQADAYEEDLLQRVVQTAAHLRASGQVDSQVAIGQQIGVAPTEMTLFPRVKCYLRQLKRARVSQRLQNRVEGIQAAITELERQGKPPSEQRINKIVGFRVDHFRHDPTIDSLVAPVIERASQYIQVRDAEQNQPLYQPRTLIIARIRQLLTEAECTGHYLLKTEVAHLLGARYGTLRDDPIIHELLEKHEQKRIQLTIAQKLDAIEHVFQQLSQQHKRITINALAHRVGLDRSELVRCKILWERTLTLVATYKQRREVELLSKVQQTVQHLRVEQRPFNLQTIGQLVGMAPMNLKRYPAILAYFNSLPEIPGPLRPPKR